MAPGQPPPSPQSPAFPPEPGPSRLLRPPLPTARAGPGGGGCRAEPPGRGRDGGAGAARYGSAGLCRARHGSAGQAPLPAERSRAARPWGRCSSSRSAWARAASSTAPASRWSAPSPCGSRARCSTEVSPRPARHRLPAAPPEPRPAPGTAGRRASGRGPGGACGAPDLPAGGSRGSRCCPLGAGAGGAGGGGVRAGCPLCARCVPGLPRSLLVLLPSCCVCLGAAGGAPTRSPSDRRWVRVLTLPRPLAVLSAAPRPAVCDSFWRLPRGKKNASDKCRLAGC